MASEYAIATMARARSAPEGRCATRCHCSERRSLPCTATRYLECDYGAVERAFLTSGRPALLTVFRNHDRWDRSNVLCLDGRIVRYSKAHRTQDMGHIDYGLAAMRADALLSYADGDALDLARIYEDLVARDDLAAYEVSTRFYEIGTPSGLADTRRHLD